jgi:hypothetical protein
LTDHGDIRQHTAKALKSFVPEPRGGATLFDTPAGAVASFTPALATALATAAASFARLDAVLTDHPLRPALLHRARLDAVRRQAAVDGFLLDPWHLAAVLEGFRLRAPGTNDHQMRCHGALAS